MSDTAAPPPSAFPIAAGGAKAKIILLLLPLFARKKGRSVGVADGGKPSAMFAGILNITGSRI
jgi:hypothetical protein